VGHVFWYTVESPTLSLRELRSIQDWFIRYQLNAVPGVAEVASVGGFVQQYQVDVDPIRLRSYGVPLSAVVEAVRNSNMNVGGNVLERTAHADGSVSVSSNRLMISKIYRGIRRRLYPDQVANVHTASLRGTLVKGHARPRRCGRRTTGVNTKNVIDVKARIAQQPPAARCQHRTVLRQVKSHRAVGRYAPSPARGNSAGHARAHRLLMHFRSILIVTIPLPLAVLAAFLGMYYAASRPTS
jgi:Cu(I)/Ag(I) efflux system membrane protein CusA/SilA